MRTLHPQLEVEGCHVYENDPDPGGFVQFDELLPILMSGP